MEHSIPILIKTITAHIDGINVDGEIRDCIGLGDRTEDDVDITEDRNGYFPWCFPSFLIVYSGGKAKCMQV